MKRFDLLRYLRTPPSRRTFLAYFLSIVAVSGTAIVGAVLFSYATFERALVEQLHEQTRVELERIGAVFTTVHSVAIPSALQLASNSTINRLMYARSVSFSEVARANTLLDQAKLADRHIHSVVVYSYARGTYYSTEHGPIPEADYPDAELSEMIRNAGYYGIYGYIPRWLDGEPVFTILVGAPVRPDGGLRGAVVTQLSERRLRAILDPRPTANRGSTFIVDADGIVLSHADESLFGTSLVGTELWQRIQNNSNGTFFRSVDGAESVVTYIVHQPMQWHIVSTTPTRLLFGDVRVTRNRIVVGTALAVGAAIVAALLLAGWIYGPVSRLREATSRLAFDFLEASDHSTDAVEIRYLDEVLEQIHGRVQSMKLKAEEAQEIEKRDLLKALLLGYANDGLSHRDTGALTLQPDGGSIQVVVCRIDSFATIAASGGQTAVTRHKRSVQEIVQSQPKEMAVAEMGEDHLALVIPVQQDSSARLVEELGTIGKRVSASTGYSVTLSVANPVAAVRDLHSAYVEAFEASAYRFRYGRGAVIRADMLSPEPPDVERTLPEASIKSLLHQAHAGNGETALRILSEITDALRDVSYSEFTFTTQYLLYELERAVRAFGRDGERCSAKLHEARIDSQWLETIDDVVGQVRPGLTFIVRSVEHETGKKTRELIAATRTIIEETYTDSNLSSKELASRLSVSANYLRETFRAIEGQSIGEAITARRLRTVTLALAETDDPIKSIQAEAGFANYNYFFRKFREEYGMTPLEYRRRAQLAP